MPKQVHERSIDQALPANVSRLPERLLTTTNNSTPTVERPALTYTRVEPCLTQNAHVCPWLRRNIWRRVVCKGVAPSFVATVWLGTLFEPRGCDPCRCGLDLTSILVASHRCQQSGRWRGSGCHPCEGRHCWTPIYRRRVLELSTVTGTWPLFVNVFTFRPLSTMLVASPNCQQSLVRQASGLQSSQLSSLSDPLIFVACQHYQLSTG